MTDAMEKVLATCATEDDAHEKAKAWWRDGYTVSVFRVRDLHESVRPRTADPWAVMGRAS